MNPKFRNLYLFLGFIGLAFLAYELVDTYADINPLSILLISLPDMVFFYLAYKTYPAEDNESSRVSI
ncbi:hypothetical protein [Mucilaginibacter sp.]|uniref:hypothetical protein n=1 Tax=Mucilaginibacter sp. TaxID=1882438 RepID=UPI003D120545